MTKANPNFTTISISKEAKAELETYMKYGDTFDSIIKLLTKNTTLPRINLPNKQEQN